MKAIEEIGIKKSIRYLLFSPINMLLKLAVYSPIRIFFLKLLGSHIGKDSIIHNINFFNIYRKGFKALKINEQCFIGDECLLDLADDIILEHDVTIAERVTVLTHINVGYKDHPLQKYFPAMNKPVIFEKGCFVGANSVILAGVKIGSCSFIAAGSIVTKDVPSNTLAGGVPAKIIRKIK